MPDFRCIRCGEKLFRKTDVDLQCGRCGGKTFIAERPNTIKRMVSR